MAIFAKRNYGWVEQDVNALLDYSQDWSDFLVGTDTIASSTWTSDSPNIILRDPLVVSKITTIWVSGGVAGSVYRITNTITTANGRRDVRFFMLSVIDPAAISNTPVSSALFNRFQSVSQFKADSLVALAWSSAQDLTDDYIWNSLLAAEADAQRQLRVFFEPTYVLPSPISATDLGAVPSGMPWVEDPGHDYEPDLFQGEGWGFLVARHKPIISVDYIQFAYPQPMNTVWNLPLEWLRLDKKYGHIRVVPAGTSYSAPFSAWMMQVLGGGRNIPQMIRIRYKAGLQNAAVQYPDLVDVVKKMALLRIVNNLMPGTSESVSADGLSQSKSVDLKVYQEAIKEKMETLMEQIHGVRTMVF